MIAAANSKTDHTALGRHMIKPTKEIDVKDNK